MSKALLQKTIADGVDINLNDFFLSVSNFYTEKDDDLADYDDERFANFRGIGEINFEDGQKLVVVTADTTRDLTERSGKKDQYEKTKGILKFYTRYDAGVFIFSDANDNFRLSLVYATPDATRTVWSNFRRFTYYVSPNLTNKTFLDRVGNCSFDSLQDIKDAFSVEKVTKGFYKQVADWYFWAVQKVTFPKDAEAEVNGRNNAVIRLITRLIFIWFMKERRLVSPDLFNQEKIATFLKSLKPDDSTYYKAICQNLFFATLNTKIEGRQFRFVKSYKGRNKDYMEHGIYRYEDHFKNREDMLVIFRDIPFLNGGLFDCLDWSATESGTGTEVRFDGFSDKEVGLDVPNYLFFSGERETDLNTEYGTKNKKYRVQGLLNILQAYNFTIDENDPNDQEVALDPELLGKVFENLLASFNPETATTARKATGSYYTPREIVDYMVTQSLKQYYHTHLSNVAYIDDKLEELLSPITTEEPANPFGEADSITVVKLTESLKIVDPAVGSGAFPMGILNKLVSVLARVDPNNRLWQEAQLKAVEDVPDQSLKQKLIKQINEQFTEKNSNYGRKLYLIQKCIYGVDIQQIAIEIAKLRFFIALLVDESIDKSKPNCGIEPLPNLDFKLMQGNSLISEFMGIDLDAEDAKSYGKLMKDETEELIEEFQNNKRDFQYEPDRSKKETLKSKIDNLIIQIFEGKLQSQKGEYLTKLENIKSKYASVPNIQQRNESIQKDTETLNKNYGFDLAQAEKQLKEFTTGQKVKPFFAWKLYFAEVFREKDGFDVVIANPPYIEHKKLKKVSSLLKADYETYSGTADIYVYFYEKGLDLLRENGFLAFISSNKFFKTSYGTKLRALLSANNVSQIVDFTKVHVFDALVATCVILISKQKPQNHMSVTSVGDDFIYSRSLNEYACINSTHVESIKLDASIWQFEDSRELAIKAKIESGCRKLCEIEGISIFRGVTTGCNDAFVVDGSVRSSLIKDDPGSKEVIKPLLQGRNIRKWFYAESANFLIFTRKGIAIDSYPVIKKHLSHFRDKLEPGKGRKPGQYNWYEIQDNTAYYKEFEKEKIIWGLTADKWTFAYDDKGHYLPSNGYILTSSKFPINLLLAMLNSCLMEYYFKFAGIMTAGGAFTLKHETIAEFPIKNVPDIKQDFLINLVDQILSITKDEHYLSNPGKQAKVKELERQINQMVYQLYGLTEDEIAIVEGRLVKDNEAGITNVPEIRPTEEVEIDNQEENIEEVAKVEIILTKDKETPGTWRYKEQKEDHPLTIYLTKEQVQELGSPESIKITITAE